MGIFQPFRDAVKLFRKEIFDIIQSNYIIYRVCPVVVFMMILIMWVCYPIITNIYFINYSILIIFVIIRVSGYRVLIIGWSSNSKYSLLGALRIISQGVSYEVRFIFIVLVFMILRERRSLVDLVVWQRYMWNLIFLFPLFVIFFIRVLAELNRRPVDLAEGESELVSGFNIEYYGGKFALIFMAEYGGILFFSLILRFFFIKIRSLIIIFIIVNICSRIIIFIRGILPRMRYDELIYLCWKIILPMSLGYLEIVIVFKVICMGIF